MTESLLIGIGGSGAKCVEAALHLCAAGLGPVSMDVMLLDADASNGNVTRTAGLITNYCAARRSLRESNEVALGDNCRLFHTAIHPANDRIIWPVVPDATTFAELFRHDEIPVAERLLMDSLFLPDSTEQKLDLQFGFQGMPAIGAAVMAAKQVQGGNAFREYLVNRLRRASGNAKIRVSVFGSIFGGTGAAGLPVVARQIADAAKDLGIADKVYIGGVLMLPYFEFNTPQETLNGMSSVLSERFIPKAQIALHYYEWLLRTRGDNGRPPLNALYLVGWPESIHLGRNRPGRTGGTGQANPSLLPELYAAAAAIDCLCSQREGQTGIFHTAISNGPFVSWRDIPAPSGGGDYAIKRGLGQLLRFAATFQYGYRQVFEKGAAEKLRQQFWYWTLVKKVGVNPELDIPKAAITNLSEYLMLFMRWAATVQTCSGTETLTPRLFQTETLTTGSLAEDGLVELATEWTALQKSAFAGLVEEASGSTMPDIYEKLSNCTCPKQSKGIGSFVRALFDQCELVAENKTAVAAPV